MGLPMPPIATWRRRGERARVSLLRLRMMGASDEVRMRRGGLGPVWTRFEGQNASPGLGWHGESIG